MKCRDCRQKTTSQAERRRPARAVKSHGADWLQRTIGNRALQRFWDSRPADSAASVSRPATGFDHGLARRPALAVQPRLEVGPGDGPHEREADTIARRVMATPAAPTKSFHIQRSCGCCDSADRSVGASASELTRGGSPVPERTRRFYEARMGHDFSTVRLHRGDRATQFNGSLGARAFTYRDHIWLGPSVRRGPGLTLAHELTHVLQQTSPGRRGPISTTPAPRSIQRNLPPPGNCQQVEHDRLRDLYRAVCNPPDWFRRSRGPWRECTASDSCNILRLKIQRNQLCAARRHEQNVRCYAGGNQGHRDAVRDARRAQARCMQFYRANPRCRARRRRRRHQRQPQRRPARTQPRGNQQFSRSFLDEMAALTGLTGTALIVYLILSEGSRIFPPRNLVPVP